MNRNLGRRMSEGNVTSPGDVQRSPPRTLVNIHRSFEVLYFGSITLDRRYTPPMLPWLVAEVKRRGHLGRAVRLEVRGSKLVAAPMTGGLATFLEHRLAGIYRFIQTSHNKRCFAYLIKDSGNANVQNCYVFQASDENTVQDLFSVMREATKELAASQCSTPTSGGTSPGSTSLADNGTQRFELLYVGKIKVSHRKPPASFIDEAVERFRILELEKLRVLHQQSHQPHDSPSVARRRHDSGTSIASLPPSLEHVGADVVEGVSRGEGLRLNSSGSECDSSIENLEQHHHQSGRHLVTWIGNGTAGGVGGSHPLEDVGGSRDSLIARVNNNNETKGVSEAEGEKSTTGDSVDVGQHVLSAPRELCPGVGQRNRAYTVGCEPSQPSQPRARSRSDSIASGQNRTMVFQIGKTDISLISLDKKSIILSKPFKDISHCSQGIRNTEHFGFICRDSASEVYLGYILKCQSESVTEEILTTLKQVFISVAAQQRTLRNQFLMCETCPMLWLHKLCMELEGLAPSKAHAAILRKLESLPSDEKTEISTKLQGAEATSTQEQNEIMMMLLRALCETKQCKHVHVDPQPKQDTTVNIFDRKNPSVLDDLKNKARRSLTSSFDNLLKRNFKDNGRETFRERSHTIDSDSSIYHIHESDSNRGSTDSSPCSTPDKKDGLYDFVEGIADDSGLYRRRSSTIGGITNENKKPIGRKVEHPKSKLIRQKTSPMMNIFMKVGNSPKPSTPDVDNNVTPNSKGSWRQAIFNRVVTPQHKPFTTPPLISKGFDGSTLSPLSLPLKRSPATLRSLWKKAIMQQILLIRMERENRKLKANQDAVQVKRLKLSYEEITPCLKDITKVWEDLLKPSETEELNVEFSKLVEYVKAGVPRSRRGEIWQLLAEQHNLHKAKKPDVELPLPYEDLLKELTAQQHAILIDLGRTFPNHPFFAMSLGAGQLSLFNLLKAYSLLDQEVGYCQGLSFIAGVLLLHTEEENAFVMLRHILFTLGIRLQYKPDMVALQIQMYQLSRLIHDQHPELYRHFERHEISPTLYAAPWFLTLFASQFPLGFVARVFDLIFLYGPEVVFKVALVLLGNHKELILQCTSFESSMEFLKTTLPSMGIIQMERLINQVFQLDFSKQLHAYEVEYHVLQEEMFAADGANRADPEELTRLETANATLRRQNAELLEELQGAHATVRALERGVSSYQACTSRQESRLRTLEMEASNLRQLVATMRRNWPPEKYDACADILSDYQHLLLPRPDSPPGGQGSSSSSSSLLHPNHHHHPLHHRSSPTHHPYDVVAVIREVEDDPDDTRVRHASGDSL